MISFVTALELSSVSVKFPHDTALQLRLNVKTVGTYRERIKHKLGIKSSASLVREAMRWTSEFSSSENPQ